MCRLLNGLRKNRPELPGPVDELAWLKICTRSLAMQVLVVEDDHSIRETLGIVLEAYEHQADLASDSEETLEILQKKLGNWPDVLLLDLRLAHETGEDVFEKIRLRFGRTLPTVVISASQEGWMRAKQIPGAAFLAKPYSIDQLLQSLEEAVRSSGLKSNSA